MAWPMTGGSGNNARAMILAAGKGTRMGERALMTPKPLTSVAGRTMLERDLDQLTKVEGYPCVVNVHHLADQVEAALQSQVDDGTVIISDERDLLRETGGGVKHALPLLASEFYTLNSDIIFFESTQAKAPVLQQLRDSWDPEQMDALLLLIPTSEAFGYDGVGDFYYPEEQTGPQAITFRDNAQAAPYMYSGVQYVKASLYEDMPDGVWSNRDIFRKAHAKGRLMGLPIEGHWLHVGTEEGIQAAEDKLRELGAC